MGVGVSKRVLWLARKLLKGRGGVPIVTNPGFGAEMNPSGAGEVPEDMADNLGAVESLKHTTEQTWGSHVRRHVVFRLFWRCLGRYHQRDRAWQVPVCMESAARKPCAAPLGTRTCMLLVWFIAS